MSRLRSACSPLRTKWKNFSLEVKKNIANISPVQTVIVLHGDVMLVSDFIATPEGIFLWHLMDLNKKPK